MKIVIVEDELLTAQFVKQTLFSLGYEAVDIADSAKETLQMFQTNSYDLIFLDINLRGSVDGLQLAKQLHIKYNPCIIFLTSYHDDATIEEASLVSPSGYLIKPIIKSDISAMMMVIKNNQNKNKPIPTQSTIDIKPYTYDTVTKNIFLNDEAVKLSKLEAKALDILIHNLNSVVSSDRLISNLWEDQKSKTSLRELISRLRKKLPHLNLSSHSNIGYIIKKDSNP